MKFQECYVILDQSILMSIDFKKAVDSVWHMGLLRKLWLLIVISWIYKNTRCDVNENGKAFDRVWHMGLLRKLWYRSMLSRPMEFKRLLS